MSSTAYQIGCTALVKLGYAIETEWGAIEKELPELPAVFPRWDDICIAVLWLAKQQNQLSFRQPDGSVPPVQFANGLVLQRMGENTTPPPNISGALGLGPAHCTPETFTVLEQLDLVAEGTWTRGSVSILWRTSPMQWQLDFQTNERFLTAVQSTIATIPSDIAGQIARLIKIEKTQIDEHIALHAMRFEDTRQSFGLLDRMTSASTPEIAIKSIEFARINALNWVFFRHWRIEEGWLKKRDEIAALPIFHDNLAIAMRRAVIASLYPTLPQFAK
ncbi:hypothetical protein [Loktanella sp. S4079]|uniref:hypothetical protein n=1 Tax=Loktanella sp. S4079 TaxID=579483 RepID=UPI0012EE875C|nr:hypothetical protein [Loktanella sp. S4079]